MNFLSTHGPRNNHSALSTAAKSTSALHKSSLQTHLTTTRALSGLSTTVATWLSALTLPSQLSPTATTSLTSQAKSAQSPILPVSPAPSCSRRQRPLVCSRTGSSTSRWTLGATALRSRTKQMAQLLMQARARALTYFFSCLIHL